MNQSEPTKIPPSDVNRKKMRLVDVNGHTTEILSPGPDSVFLPNVRRFLQITEVALAVLGGVSMDSMSERPWEGWHELTIRIGPAFFECCGWECNESDGNEVPCPNCIYEP